MSAIIKQLPDSTAQSMIKHGIWAEECPVSLAQLRLLEIEHYDFSGNIKSGEMIVLDQVAENVAAIFQELFSVKFPIAKICLMDRYAGDDNLAMADNNSSCFNFRKIAGSDRLSMHSYGLAIDINPVQNPYIIINADKTVSVHPKEGADYLNRHNLRPGMVEPVASIFAKHGFNIWGGKWNEPIDYHHFQVERETLITRGLV